MTKAKPKKILSWIITLALILSNFIGFNGSQIAKAADGNGNIDNPYTVAHAIGIQNNSIASVIGYIVGQPTSANVVLSGSFTGDTAIAIADTVGETDVAKMLYVQLPTTPAYLRAEYALKTNPTNMGMQIKVTGNLTPYFTPHSGLKNTTFIEKVGTPPTQVDVTGVSLDKITVSLEEGQTALLNATVLPANATNKKVTWTTDKPEVVTVLNGTLTAIGAGTATITVTTEDGNKTATCNVNVTPKPVGDFTKPEISNLNPASGDSTGLVTRPTISANYSDPSGIDLNSIILKVDDVNVTNLATITSTGITYVPSIDLTIGEHKVMLEVKDTVSPSNISILEWNFYVGEQKFNFYFGGLHSHTNLSDGTGTPGEAYTWARDNAKADFLAITDHSNWFDGEKDLGNETITDFNSSTSTEWKKLHEIADTFNKDDDFVAIGAFEMTWSGSTGGWGHINTFNTPWFTSRSNPKMDLKSYYSKLAQNPQSISQLNHPGTTFGDFSDFGYYTPEADKVVNLIEVGNGEGPVRGSGYYPSYDLYTRALDKGWHLAPTNNQDNHKGIWVNANTARTVILAPNLTRDSLYDAMRNRRVYATEDNNLRIDYTINNKPMGSILDSPDTLSAKITINDPDANDVIGKVSVIVDGGKVLQSKTFATNSAQWDISFPTGYSYYYIRVDESDKDIAVSAPIWASTVVPVGISKVEVSQDPQIINTPVEIASTIYNNSTQSLTNIKVEYFQNSVTPENKIGEGTISSIASSSMGTSKITWTPTQTGDIKIYAQAIIAHDGTNKVFTQSTTFRVAQAEDMFKVVIDAGHVNQYVNGDYAGKILTLTSMLKDKKYMLVQNTDELTAQDLQNTNILMITDPQSVKKDALTPSKFTDKEIQVIKNFIDGGGSLIITSRADYNDKGVIDSTYQSSVQGNSILEVIGSNLRFNDDEVIDKTSNGGQEFRLYFDDYTSSKYNLTSNVPSGETYSFYSGCSVVLKSGGDEATIDWLVKGHDTTEILDSDLANDATPVVKGNVNVLAAEVLPSGSKVIVAGSTFFSDFETASVDNAYSNKLITDNIISWMSIPAPAPLKSIAEVRADLNNDGIPDNYGKRFTIEGRITAQSEAVVPKNSFFEVIYVQDTTGGICIFGVSNTVLPLGTKVRVTGTVGQYLNDSQLSLSDESKQIEIIDNTISLVAPKIMSTKISMEEASEGWLVKIQGKVTRIEGQNMFINDGTGEARAYLEGYISDETGNDVTRGKWNPNIKVGDNVSVIGLASQDPEGHRLRVRNTSEVVLLDSTPPVITITGVANNRLYNVNVTPVIAVDDINAVVTKTLNGKPYNGETITVDGTYQLVVTAIDLIGNLSKETINFTIDKTAPLITVNIANGSIFERLGTINIITLAEDTTSGINTLEITLDGAKISNNETVKLETLALRNHQIVITAVDKAGNIARKEVNFTITGSKESLTNLLEKFYNEGLIKNKGIYNSLNTKLSKGNLTAFTHELLAQKGKGVDEHAANVLLDYVNWIN
ncbi:CehA/McbA family metallohydrolase [Clostridium sp.]|uniref:CehA/McbA family metallohydrolase n=1 Tax=Clostridium sp. TaxID=1506 RepID=UPI002FCB7650